jgi:hypothetical protein
VEAVEAVAAINATRDRIDIGWRPELPAGIFAHLDRIDVVEVIADKYLTASRRELRALRTLADHIPLVVPSVGFEEGAHPS